jgi:hypothetical protein
VPEPLDGGGIGAPSLRQSESAHDRQLEGRRIEIQAEHCAEQVDLDPLLEGDQHLNIALQGAQKASICLRGLPAPALAPQPTVAALSPGLLLAECVEPTEWPVLRSLKPLAGRAVMRHYHYG